MKSVHIEFPSCPLLIQNTLIPQVCPALARQIPRMVRRHMRQEVGKEAPLVGKGPEKGRRLEGKDWISVFFLLNLCAALEDCRRHSEGLF